MGWSRVVGIVGLAGLLMGLGAASPEVFAVEEDEELPIGVPDFPRRVRRELPGLRPEQEIRIGIVKLHPSFVSTIQYDDNIFLRNSDDVDDVILTETPGVIAEFKLGDHRFEAGYGIEIVEFLKRSEENATNHLAHMQLDLEFDNVSVTVTDTMETATGRVFNETSARSHVFLNTVEVMGRYDRPMWALEGGWTHNTVDQLTDVFNNRDYGEDVLGVLAGYKITGKTLLLLENTVGFVNYDHNVDRADHTYWQFLTGVRGELSPKVTSTVKLGYQVRSFTDTSGEENTGADEFVADTELVYSPSSSDVWKASYRRGLKTSTFGSNNYYRRDKLSLSYRKRFAKKWLFTPRFAWQLNDYPNEGTSSGDTRRRKDSFFSVSTALRYEIQEWLSTGVSYKFRNRDSNLNSLDYENNRLTFDVTLAF